MIDIGSCFEEISKFLRFPSFAVFLGQFRLSLRCDCRSIELDKTTILSFFMANYNFFCLLDYFRLTALNQIRLFLYLTNFTLTGKYDFLHSTRLIQINLDYFNLRLRNHQGRLLISLHTLNWLRNRVEHNLRSGALYFELFLHQRFPRIARHLR